MPVIRWLWQTTNSIRMPNKKIDTLDWVLFIKLARSIEQLKSVLDVRQCTCEKCCFPTSFANKYTNRLKGNLKKKKERKERAKIETTRDNY